VGTKLVGLVAILGLLLAACPDGDDNDAAESLLDTVQSRGELICGVNDAVVGFGFQT
jgi:ABC-type amino acid transport substrate-binding protein